MDDVELLVLTFYEFAERLRLEALNAGGMSHTDEHSDDHASNAGAAKKANGLKGSSAGAVNEERKNGLSSTNVNEAGVDGLPVDDDALVIDNDDIVLVLKEFHKKREERANNADLVGNPRMKKRSNFESEE
jgi:hypothetical protein